MANLIAFLSNAEVIKQLCVSPYLSKSNYVGMWLSSPNEVCMWKEVSFTGEKRVGFHTT